MCVGKKRKEKKMINRQQLIRSTAIACNVIRLCAGGEIELLMFKLITNVE